MKQKKDCSLNEQSGKFFERLQNISGKIR